MDCTKSVLIVALLSALGTASLAAQPSETNYDESKVPEYTLPDPLRMADGRPVADAAAWRDRRRPEILELFREHV